MPQPHGSALSCALSPAIQKDGGRYPTVNLVMSVIALIGAWRFREHRSVPQMHQRLQTRGLAISERAVTHLLHRYARTGELTPHRSGAHQDPVTETRACDPGAGWLTAGSEAGSAVGGTGLDRKST